MKRNGSAVPANEIPLSGLILELPFRSRTPRKDFRFSKAYGNFEIDSTNLAEMSVFPENYYFIDYFFNSAIIFNNFSRYFSLIFSPSKKFITSCYVALTN